MSPLAERKNSNNGAELLREGGYSTNPCITWRWRKNSDEVYGRGPGHDAWVTIARLNQESKDNLHTAHLSSDPPLVAYSDLRNAIQKDPGGTTFVEENRGDIRTRMPQPLYTGVNNLPFNIEYMDRDKAIINQYFHTDVFMMMSQLAQQGKSQRMVIEQVMELQSEKAAILGTRIGNLHSEGCTPLIIRVYDILSRQGKIPEVPDILKNIPHDPIKVSYLGVLAQAQTRLTKVRSIQAGLSLLEMATKTLGPQITDWIDDGETAKDLVEAVGFPAKNMRTDEQVAKIRKIRQKEIDEAKKIDAAPKLAKAAAAMGRASEKGSPLGIMMGQGGEGLNG